MYKINKHILLLFTLFGFLCINSCTKNKEIEKDTLTTDLGPGEKLPPPSVNFSIAFYNVENLFDTINSFGNNDDDFTPQGRYQWDTKRYFKKLAHIGQALSYAGHNGSADIFGLAEIENKMVVRHLIDYSVLKDKGYEIIHREGPDRRGIDNALVYKTSIFTPIATNWYSILFPFSPYSRTREILHVQGLVGSDTLNIFVNHWYSRIPSVEQTAKFRNYSAGILRQKVDAIFERNPNSNIVIMGDFNDDPENASMQAQLKAKAFPNDSPEAKSLYNLSYNPHQAGEGTLYYNGWNYFDQIIVSSNILDNYTSKTRLVGNKSYVVKEDFMTYMNYNGEKVPSRTYSGNRYYGGYSDHFPVFIEMEIK